MKKLFICIAAFSLLSCSNKNASIISLFDRIENITSIPIIQPKLSQYPYGLTLFDSLLVWVDSYHDKNLSLFNVHKRKEMHRFGTIGQGPSETSDWPSATKYQNNYLHILDNKQNKLLVFSINEIAKDSVCRPVITYNLFQNASLLKIIQIDDNLFIGENRNSDNMYALVNDKGNIVFTGLSYPRDKNITISSNIKLLAYQGNFYQNPINNNELIHVGINGVVIDILEIRNNKIIRKKLLDYVLPEYTAVQKNDFSGALISENSIIGCCSVSVTGNFIYVLYADKTRKNKNENKENERCSNLILIFDWNGTPIKYYKSDVDLYQICVSEDNQTLYGVIMNPEAELVKFEL